MINYEKILKELTLEEKIGQLFCLSVTEKNEKSEYLPALGKIRPGRLIYRKYHRGKNQRVD